MPRGTLTLSVYAKYIVRDRDGRIIKESKWFKDPLLRNFIKMLCGVFSASPRSEYETIVATDGSVQPFPYLYSVTSAFASVLAPTDNVSYGIVFGSGTTPPTLEDYRLEALLGTDVLSYGATSLGKVGALNTSYAFEVVRTVSALADVSIGEVGLIARQYSYAAIDVFFLVARTVLSEPISLVTGKSLTWIYRFKISI